MTDTSCYPPEWECSKIRENPFFPHSINELAVALGIYWRELATKVNAYENISVGNADDEIGNLPISDVYTQAEVQELRDKCEELADDVRTLRCALVRLGLIVIK